MKRRLCSILLALALMLSLLPAFASTAHAASGKLGDNLTWTLSSSGKLTISGSGAMVTWSDSWSQPWHDYRKDITSVVISNGVTSVSSFAFHQCENLTTVSIPASVTYWNSDAFNYCYNLTSFSVASGNTALSTDSYGVLFNKDKTKLYNYPTGRAGTYTVPNTVIDIYGHAFHSSRNLTAVILPNGLKGLGNCVFQGCTSLTSVTLPDSVISIGGYVFQGCTNLTSAWLSDNMNGFAYGVFSGCTGLTQVHLPAALYEIPRSTFSGCTSLTSIDIPENVSYIRAQAFDGCTKLTDITLPDKIKAIETRAFYGCSSLTQINIPAAVQTVADKAFYRCNALTDVYYGGPTAQWSAISIGTDNEPLTNAKLHCSDDQSQAEAVMACIHALPAPEVLQLTDKAQLTAARESYDALTPVQQALVTNLQTLTAAEEAMAVLESHVHNHSAVVTAPTCTDPGYTTYTCSCGDTYTADEVDALGHYLEAAVTAPTCTDPGYTTYTCSCGYAYTADEEGALGHSYDDGVIITQPTTTAEGVKTFTCQRPNCGDSYTESVPKKAPNPFTDVKKGAFYYEPVMWAISNGVTSGLSATTFGPDATCTRAQVVTFLWRAAGSPAPTSTECPFTDVSTKGFYYKAMMWAVENGITSGLSATTFGPDEPCTRGQVVTFLWRAAGKPAATNDTCNFTDVSAKGFYYKAMMWAVENGVTTGTSKTTFAPDAPCTRAQVVTFLYRTFR